MQSPGGMIFRKLRPSRYTSSDFTESLIFGSGVPGGLAVVEASPEEVQEVPVEPAVAPLENVNGGSADGQKIDKPSVRLRNFLNAKKGEQQLTNDAQKNTDSTNANPKAEDFKGEDFAADIEAMLPEQPKDWLDKKQPVSAEQQEPAKPRGRKKKSNPDGVTPTAKAKAKAKARVGKKADAQAKPKAKAKATRNKGLKKVRQAKAKARPSSSSQHKVIKRIGKGRKQKTPQHYEPLEVEPVPLPEKGQAFDSYAAACAAADVQRLQTTESPEVLASTSKRKRGTLTAKDSKEDSKSNNKPTKGAVDPKKRKAEQQTSGADKKARLSRKSCAYKKAYKQHINDGSSEEVARAAAKQVSWFNSNFVCTPACPP